MHGHRHETSILHGCRQIRCDAEGSILRTLARAPNCFLRI
jgi:hypothetical protein